MSLSSLRSRPCLRLVVVGTGTDVGKTHVAAALVAHARACGLRVAAYKPVASGVGVTCEDADRLGAPPPSFAYARPVSPHLAARGERRPIDLAVIRARAEELAMDADFLLVESAGGLFSPLAPHLTNVDLARAVAPARVLLVGMDRLGALHDVRATMLAAGTDAARLAIDAVVLSSPETPDQSTGTNAAELATVGTARVSAVFPRSAPDSAGSLAAAARAFSDVFA